MIENLKIGIVSIALGIASLFGYVDPQNQIDLLQQQVTDLREVQLLGSTYQTPDVRALFSTTLATKITSSATSMTLSTATDKDGNTLASSTYGFIIDEGTSVEEMVLADCTGTTCTNMTRGLSVSTATTSVSSLRFEHRRGASVKITTAPSLVFVTNAIKGKQNIENILRYNSSQTFNNSNDIISRSYADSLSFGAIPAASETASGFVELSTNIETASSTSLGSTGARLAIPASLATSTYNSATAALKVVVTKNDGKIDSNFLPSTIPQTSGTNTWTGVNTFSTSTSATTTIGAFPAWEIGKQVKVFTSNGTFTVPTGITKVYVRLCGGGGGGGQGSGTNYGGGGAGGGCGESWVNVSATTSIGVGVGIAGAGHQSSQGDGTNGGTSNVGSYTYCTGGEGGGDTSNEVKSGGSCTGADVNLPGESTWASGSTTINPSGDSKMGYGADNGINPTGYASGGKPGTASGSNGGDGTAGIVIFNW